VKDKLKVILQGLNCTNRTVDPQTCIICALSNRSLKLGGAGPQGLSPGLVWVGGLAQTSPYLIDIYFLIIGGECVS